MPQGQVAVVTGAGRGIGRASAIVAAGARALSNGSCRRRGLRPGRRGRAAPPGDGARAGAVEAIVEGLDAKGRWLEDGAIESATVIRRYEALVHFLMATSPAGRTPARAIAAIADPMGNGLHAEGLGLVAPGPNAAPALPASRTRADRRHGATPRTAP
jgi:NAD(P)-dependent dehydrogenase (short-subunit alcohol dehydrogenase family)